MLLFAGGAASTAPPTDPLHRDATATHLPAGVFGGANMDAQPADADGDLDIIVALLEGRSDPRNRLLDDGSGASRDATDGRLQGIRLAPYRVYVGDGRGHFEKATRAVFLESAVGAGFDVEEGDFDGDEQPDFYLASRGSPDRLPLGVPR